MGTIVTNSAVGARLSNDYGGPLRGVPQEEVTCQANKYLVILSSKAYVFGGELTMCWLDWLFLSVYSLIWLWEYLHNSCYERGPGPLCLISNGH